MVDVKGFRFKLSDLCSYSPNYEEKYLNLYFVFSDDRFFVQFDSEDELREFVVYLDSHFHTCPIILVR